MQEHFKSHLTYSRRLDHYYFYLTYAITLYVSKAIRMDLLDHFYCFATNRMTANTIAKLLATSNTFINHEAGTISLQYFLLILLCLRIPLNLLYNYLVTFHLISFY